MDKQLLKAYIRTIVEEEVKRILPEMLSEAVSQVKKLSENTEKRPINRSEKDLLRSRISDIMKIDRDGDTIMATTKNLVTVDPSMGVDPAVVNAVNRDYSEIMKKLNLT